MSTLDILHGAVGDRYRIEGEIGRGGMGTVYVALDVKHERLVAIKVIRSDGADVTDAARFTREIRIAAHLAHAHIVPVFDSGSADGLLFYVMPYVEGDTVRDRLRARGPFDVADALRIGQDVASALAFAHSRGVIHRDIKPANILLSGGGALVTDFGVAKAFDLGGATTTLTLPAAAPGTVAYMSPEQAAGFSLIDGRSDVYSLGCVLYEMIAGRPLHPYGPPRHDARKTGPSLAEGLGASSAIRAVIAKALEPSAGRRHASASEFETALAGVTPAAESRSRGRTLASRLQIRPSVAVWLGLALVSGAVGILRPFGPRDAVPTPVGSPPLSRIAVLYFDDGSPDGSLGWLARGLTEDLIDMLSAGRGLTVTSRNGVRAFSHDAPSPDSVARALRVGLLVDGSVEPADSTYASVRVSLRLIDGSTGVQLDRLVIESPKREPLALRREIAADLEQLLRTRLGVEVRLREDRDAAPDDRAWEEFRRGGEAYADALELAEAGDAAGAAERFATADSLFRASERPDRRWIRPIIARGEVDIGRAIAAEAAGPGEEARLGRSRAWLSSARGHAERALALSPGDAHGLALRGESRLRAVLFGGAPGSDTLLASAVADLERATRADARLARAWYGLATSLRLQGRLEESRMAGERALEEDVYAKEAPSAITQLLFTALDRGADGDASSWCALGRRHYPADLNFRQCELTVLGRFGQDGESVDRAWTLVASLDTVDALRDLALHRRATVAAVLTRTGLPDSARAVLDRARLQAADRPSVAFDVQEAWVRTLLGDVPRALEILAGVVADAPEERSMLATHPLFLPLRHEPAFQRLVGPP